MNSAYFGCQSQFHVAGTFGLTGVRRIGQHIVAAMHRGDVVLSPISEKDAPGAAKPLTHSVADVVAQRAKRWQQRVSPGGQSPRFMRGASLFVFGTVFRPK